jgi:diadenosine tetraphosphate (Ap4A) HIT family hydrolase
VGHDAPAPKTPSTERGLQGASPSDPDGIPARNESGATCDGSDLCAELAGDQPNAFAATYEGEPESRVLEESANFATIADISPLVEGHLLVAPRRHYFNFAAAMLEHRDEATAALSSAARWVRETYGASALFEHGTDPSGIGGACIHHAHVHVLPVAAVHLVAVMRSDGLDVATVSDIHEWARAGSHNRSYLLCSDGQTFTMAFPSQPPRRQYLRAAAGEVLGIPDPEWDWSVVIRKHLLRATVEKYRSNRP